MRKKSLPKEVKLTVSSEHGLCCPECGRDDEIDISAEIWVRLTPDGTDADESHCGDHYWDDDSAARCLACNHNGTVLEFSLPEAEAEVKD